MENILQRTARPLVAIAAIALLFGPTTHAAPDNETGETNGAGTIVRPASKTNPTPRAAPQGVAFGRETPPLLTEATFLDRLRLFSPEWMKQNLTWPSELEQRIHGGVSSYEQRLELLAWLNEVLEIRIPADILDNVLTMREWQVLYPDWARNMGADAFVLRFTSGIFVVHVSEVPSALVIMVRPLRVDNIPARDPVDFAYRVGRMVLKGPLLPASPERITSKANSMLIGAFDGSWKPVAQGSSRKGFAVDTPSRPYVEFFVQGDLCGYLIDKDIYVGDHSELLRARFGEPERPIRDDDVLMALQEQMIRSPLLRDPAARVEYYERLRRTLNIKTIEEFLGPMLFDSTGSKLTANKLDYRRLEEGIERLTEDQRAILLKQRRVDWHYLEGLKAFEEERLDEAIDHWSRALSTEPLNVRIALLLDVAVQMRVEREFGGSRDKAGGDVQIDNAAKLIAYHIERVSRNALRQVEEDRKERLIGSLRAEALKLYNDQMYRQSYDKWHEILAIDERNSIAQIYAALCMSRMETTGGAVDERR